MVEIRNAIVSDFDRVNELLVQLYDKNEIDQLETEKLFLLELENKEVSQIVVTLDNVIVGFASASSRIDYQSQGKISMLTCLIVDHKFRDKGIGKKLLQEIENICKSKGSLELQFSSTFRRVDSHKFYESQGYCKTAYYFWKNL